jgi:hypothetical protein
MPRTDNPGMGRRSDGRDQRENDRVVSVYAADLVSTLRMRRGRVNYRGCVGYSEEMVLNVYSLSHTRLAREPRAAISTSAQTDKPSASFGIASSST